MKRGEVYYLDSVPPLRGGNLKDRRVVIVTETEDIMLDNTIVVVACTSQLFPGDEALAVPLPWHARKGVACTGFTKPTWAMPNWFLEVRPSDLRSYSGHVPTDKLKLIKARMPIPDRAVPPTPLPPDAPKG